jgi:hypothetical protein
LIKWSVEMHERAFISIEITAKRVRSNRHVTTHVGEKKVECSFLILSKFCRIFPFLR